MELLTILIPRFLSSRCYLLSVVQTFPTVAILKELYKKHNLLKMNSDRDILDPSWMCLQGTFDEQVTKLFHFVRLSKAEIEEDLLSLFKDVVNTLGTRWPGCELTPYGSLYQGLGLKSSDVDCFVQIPIQYKTIEDALVTTARDVLSRRPDIFAELFAATNVPVPIVKFYHQPTNRECDLTFDCPPGVYNSSLLWYLLNLDERAMHLAVLVKYWAKVHNFIGPYLLRSYALTLMVIFYLQQLDILPTIQILQSNIPYVPWRVWNVAFEKCVITNNNQSSLRQLLGGFLLFFSTYKFEENIISPFVGRSIEREHFKCTSDIPKEFELYKTNLKSKICEQLKLDTPMCVQDVFNHSSNCSVGVLPELAQNIRERFRMAAKLYKIESQENFLKAIILNMKC